MSKIDSSYKKLLETILSEGFTYEDPNRKGVNRVQIHEYTFRHDFKDGFPALSTKEVYFKGAVGELIAFLSGSTDIRDLWKRGINFWDKDWINYQSLMNPLAELLKKDWKDGKTGLDYQYQLGKIYPYQMRSWDNFEDQWDAYGSWENNNIDQFQNLIQTLRDNPMATKKTVTMWNPANLDESCLSPCHWSFEALVEPLSITERLDLYGLNILSGKIPYEEEMDNFGIPRYSLTIKWHQHSVDTFLGLPINIMYYSLMSHIIGKMVNMVPKGVIGDLSNVHIYEPHLDAVKKQLKNDVNKYEASELDFDFPMHFFKATGDVNDITERLQVYMFKLKGYESYPAIRADMLAYNK